MVLSTGIMNHQYLIQVGQYLPTLSSRDCRVLLSRIHLRAGCHSTVSDTARQRSVWVDTHIHSPSALLDTNKSAQNCFMCRNRTSLPWTADRQTCDLHMMITPYARAAIFIFGPSLPLGNPLLCPARQVRMYDVRGGPASRHRSQREWWVSTLFLSVYKVYR